MVNLHRFFSDQWGARPTWCLAYLISSWLKDQEKALKVLFQWTFTKKRSIDQNLKLGAYLSIKTNSLVWRNISFLFPVLIFVHIGPVTSTWREITPKSRVCCLFNYLCNKSVTVHSSWSRIPLSFHLIPYIFYWVGNTVKRTKAVTCTKLKPALSGHPRGYPAKIGCVLLYSPYLFGKKLFSTQDKLVNNKQTRFLK